MSRTSSSRLQPCFLARRCRRSFTSSSIFQPPTEPSSPPPDDIMISSGSDYKAQAACAVGRIGASASKRRPARRQNNGRSNRSAVTSRPLVVAQYPAAALVGEHRHVGCRTRPQRADLARRARASRRRCSSPSARCFSSGTPQASRPVIAEIRLKFACAGEHMRLIGRRVRRQARCCSRACRRRACPAGCRRRAPFAPSRS